MKHYRSYPPARGFTAIELIVVLIIGFSIIALASGKITTMFSASKNTSAVATITELASIIHQRGMEGIGETKANSKVLESFGKEKILPPSLKAVKDDAGTIKDYSNEWGGVVCLEYALDGTSGKYTLKYPNVPVSSCKKIADAMNRSNILEYVTSTGASPNVKDRTATPDEICKVSGNGASVELQFIIAL